jgi:hypothetical protein
MNYQKYVDLFNSGNDEVLVKTFFTEDTVFSGGSRALHGADELLKFLHGAHDGIREILRPQVVAQNDDCILAEIDIDFHAPEKGRDDDREILCRLLPPGWQSVPVEGRHLACRKGRFSAAA